MPMPALMRSLTLLLCAGIVCAGAALAQSPDQRALERERTLGNLMAQQFRERNGAVEIPEAQAYLERVVKELAAAQPGEDDCCAVTLFARAEADSKPVVFPGGHLFVPAKLFFVSPDEAAFVKALAHAVAHVRQRDWVRMGAQTADPDSLPENLALQETDDAEALPDKLRPQFESREKRADEAAEKAVEAVTMGTGEFERIRDKAPLPTARPSLKP